MTRLIAHGVFAMLTLATTVHAATYYVSQFDGNNANDGLSWGKAKATIQAAVTNSVDGDTIWVDEGEYSPITTDNKRIRIISLYGTDTIIDNGAAGRRATLGTEPSHTNTVLEGFTLRNGWATGSTSYGAVGGGAYGGTLIDCDLLNNRATDGGGSYGGMLIRCWIESNGTGYDDVVINRGGGSYGGTLIDCDLLNNKARHGGGAYGSTLNGCKIYKNKAENTTGEAQGGGAHGGTLTDCFLCSNTALVSPPFAYDAKGGGAFESTLINCILTSNGAGSLQGLGNAQGGGSWGGTLNGCTLLWNQCVSLDNDAKGGGVYGGTLDFCSLGENVCGSLAKTKTAAGGGAYGATLNNCELINNMAKYRGVHLQPSDVTISVGAGAGFTFWGIFNLGFNFGVSWPASYELVADVESWGGGAWGSTLNNCLLWKNEAWGGGGADSSVLNNCTVVENTSRTDGGGIRNCPQVNNSIVKFNTSIKGSSYYQNCYAHSPCLCSINNSNIDPIKIVGNTYLGITDSYPYPYPIFSIINNRIYLASCIDSDPKFVDRANGNFRLQQTSPCIKKGNNALVVGTMDLDGNTRIWPWDSTVDMGAYEYGAPLATHIVTFNDNNGNPASQTITQTYGSSYILPPTRPTQTGYIFMGWFTAISGGVCVTLSTTVTTASNHTLYAQWMVIPPGTTWYVDALRPNDTDDGKTWETAKKTIQAAVTAAAAKDTIVVWQGTYTPISTANKAVTIQGVGGAGVTIIDGKKNNRCATLGTASGHTNTVLIGFTLENGRTDYGGGVRGGTLNNCVIQYNTATIDGGGAYYSTLNNCVLTGNTAKWGGGVYQSTVNNSTLTGNSASNTGGGAWTSTLNNCLLMKNTSGDWGGGADLSTLNNCLLAENKGKWGGGAASSTLVNCTVVKNDASGYTWGKGGGGVNKCTVYNCIVYGNTGWHGGITTDQNNLEKTTMYNTSNGDIVPMFVDYNGGDYRLQPDSPCRDKGNNAYVVGTTDLDGNIRIWNGTVDMGAYEYGAPSIIHTVTLNPNGGSGGTASVTATYGLTMPSASVPTRVGYTFQGYWDTSAASGGTQYYTATMGSVRNWDKTQNTMLYARWSITPYTVTLNRNNGSGGTASVTATYGSAMPSAIAPTRIGYTFQGYWDTSAVSGGTQYYTATMGSVRNWDKTQNTMLYARWSINPYTVTFDRNNGSGGTASVTATYGSAMPSATAPTRVGYTFQGYWDTSAASGGTQYYTATMGSVRNWDKAQNTTLYARWTQVATLTTPCLVPFSWLNQWGGNSGNYETLANSRGANGCFVWESYVAGLDPTNPTSKFQATIKMQNGVPYVDWTPNLGNLRSYTKEMKENLSDPWQLAPDDLSTLPPAPSRFFRVRVEEKK